MNRELFIEHFGSAVDHVISNDGDENLPVRYFVNIGGGRTLNTLDELYDIMGFELNKCPRVIDLGILNSPDLNMMYVVVSAFPYVDCEQFSDLPYKLPIKFLGRATNVRLP